MSGRPPHRLDAGASSVRTLFEIVPSLRQAETDRPAGVGGTCWLPTLSPGADPWRTLLDAVATLYVAGVPIDFRRLDDGSLRRRVALPTYRFQRRRHWFREAEGTNGELATASGDGRGSAGNARTLSDEELRQLSESEAEELLIRELNGMDY